MLVYSCISLLLYTVYIGLIYNVSFIYLFIYLFI